MPPLISPTVALLAAVPRAISMGTASCFSPRPPPSCRPRLFLGLPRRLARTSARPLVGRLARLLGSHLAARLALDQHAAPALRSPTAAGEDFIDVGRILRVAFDLIIVGQLLTGLDGPNGLDVDPLLVRRARAVRFAAMVDVA